MANIDWSDLANRIAKRKRSENDDEYVPAKTSHRRTIDKIGQRLSEKINEHISKTLKHYVFKLGKAAANHKYIKSKINAMNNSIESVKGYAAKEFQASSFPAALKNIQSKVYDVLGNKAGNTLSGLINKTNEILKVQDNDVELDNLLKSNEISGVAEKVSVEAAEGLEKAAKASMSSVFKNAVKAASESLSEAASKLAAKGVSGVAADALDEAFGPEAMALGFALDVTGGDKLSEYLGDAIEKVIDLIPDTPAGKDVKLGINTTLGTLGDSADVMLAPFEELSKQIVGTDDKAATRLTSDDEFSLFKQMIHDSSYSSGASQLSWFTDNMMGGFIGGIASAFGDKTISNANEGFIQSQMKLYAPNDYAKAMADYKSKVQQDDEHSGDNIAKVELNI